MKPIILYIGGIVTLALIGVGGLVAMEWLRPDGYNTAIVGQIISIVVPTMAVLIDLVKSIGTGKAVEEVKTAVENS